MFWPDEPMLFFPTDSGAETLAYHPPFQRVAGATLERVVTLLQSWERRYGAEPVANHGTSPSDTKPGVISVAEESTAWAGLSRPTCLGGLWIEALNADSARSGSSNAGNPNRDEAEPIPWHGQATSAEMTLPPLAVVWLGPAIPQHESAD